MDDIGERNRQRFDAPDAVASYRAEVDLTPAELAIFERSVPAGSRVLDLGVGTGRTTPWLAARSSTYLGIDIAPSMIAAARARLPAVAFEVGDAADLDGQGDGSFDVVVFSFNGIDYVSDRDRGRVLDEVRRVLVPGGSFVFSSHSPRALLVPPPPAGPHLRRWAISAWSTANRVRRLAGSRALRTGSGWVLDPVKGGLMTHHATPARVHQELDRHGFELEEQVAGDLPRRPAPWRTPWWYYAATRR